MKKKIIALLAIAGICVVSVPLYLFLVNEDAPQSGTTAFITGYSPRSHIRLSEDDTQEFNITTSFPTGSILIYEWYVNETQEGTSANSFIFDTSTRSSGVYRIKVNITDGTFVLYHNWTVLVSNTGGGIIIDRECVGLSSIPTPYILAAKEFNFHYAHTSHGGQITSGLNYVQGMDSLYNYSREFNNLSVVANTLCMYDGNGIVDDTYIDPPKYWQEPEGIAYTFNVIDNNPTLNLSMWCWCRQVNSYSPAEVQQYLDQMDSFEDYYATQGRNIRFIYMTGNADYGDYPEGTPAEIENQNTYGGYNRYLNNELIREYCLLNDKILFDFADIECWLYDEEGTPYDYSTYNYDTGSEIVSVPKRHWQYSTGGGPAHTTALNCENKGKAFWWMLATIAGWEP